MFKIKKLDSFQLKMIMALLMVLDHIAYFIPSNLALAFHVITRCVGVWFAYTAVEGFIYTHNRIKYNTRLFVWAGIMFTGNSLLNFLYKSNPNVYISNNIFLTLAGGVLVLNLLGLVKVGKMWMKVASIALSIGITLAGFMFTEGGFVIIPFMLITYYLRNKPKIRNICYLVMAIYFAFSAYVPYPSLETTIKEFIYNGNFLFLTVLPFIYLYNGERGLNNKFSKYFFYVFYPVHLWVITTIAYFII